MQKRKTAVNTINSIMSPRLKLVVRKHLFLAKIEQLRLAEIELRLAELLQAVFGVLRARALQEPDL